MVWPGCTTPPIRSSRKPILSRKKEDFAFPKSPAPSRSEIVGKLGEPDAWLPELRVACYKVNEVTRRNLELFVVIPVNVWKRPGYVDVAFIEFDESDHVRRSGVSTEFYRLEHEKDKFKEPLGGWPALAKKWLASQELKQREH